MYIKDFSTFQETPIGSSISRPVALLDLEESEAKNGNPFITAKLSDGSSTVVAKQFNTTEASVRNAGMEPPCVVQVKVNAENFNGNKSYKIINMEQYMYDDYSINDFIATIPEDAKDLFDQIIRIVQDAKPAPVFFDDQDHASISDMTIDMLNEHKEQILYWSGAVGNHHALLGGLIYHTAKIVMMAERAADVYPNLDKELLVCGAALHDIGKLVELNTDKLGQSTFSVRGTLFGHLFIGAEMVAKKAKEMNCDPERALLLEHIIASHHGQEDFGAIKTPAIPEAMVVHFLDQIDAKNYMFQDVYNEMEPGEVPTGKTHKLGTYVYKPTDAV